MKSAVRMLSLILLSSLYSFGSNAACVEAPSTEYECRGAKLVTNQSELDTYLSNFALNANQGFVRGVRLQGNFTGESLNIATPCRIIVMENTTIDVTGDICLNSGEMVVARDGFTLKGANALLKAPERVIIQNNANVTMTGDLELYSNGGTIESRAHIRHTSSITAANLKVKGLRRATLGRESTCRV